MQPLITCLLYIFIGVIAYTVLFKIREELSVLYRTFFIAAPVVAIISLSIGYLHMVFGNSVATLVNYLLLVTNITSKGQNILLGYCLSGIFFKTIPKSLIIDERCILIIRGLSIAIGLTFISAALGKILGLSFMIQFFIQSGYTKSFLYFIMASEFIFGLILLFNIRFYLKIAALVMLLSIMIGAVVTHVRNHDPLDDAGSAILLGFKVLVLMGVYLLERCIKNRINPLPASPVNLKR